MCLRQVRDISEAEAAFYCAFGMTCRRVEAL
jgi:hypothetical protein